MVLIEDITDTHPPKDENMTTTTTTNGTASSPSPSQERLMDADEIESLISQLKRPMARLQVETLVKKMRKEAASLQALESTNNVVPKSTSTTTLPVPTAAPTPVPIPVSATNVGTTTTIMYTSIDKFAFDAGGYSEKFVTLYLPLPGVGSISKDQITCTFTKDSLDLIVQNLNGKNYRLKKDNLEHDIEPDQSKYIVKADKIVVKLHKHKGEYGSFDYWSKLTDPKRATKKGAGGKDGTGSKNPADSITEMMKEMYENGDDNMRKIIGETMLKQRNGELGKDSLGGGVGAGGDLGGMDDF